MPTILFRLLVRFSVLWSWWTPIAVTMSVFITSWPLMALVEPAGSTLVQPANYWWYFVVTAATVGYGDFYPESSWGHLVGAYVIVGGIVTLTTVFTRMASVLEQVKGRRMRGSGDVELAHHNVVLGYEPERTERIVRELLTDSERGVVLTAREDCPTHPMPEDSVEFVRGELTDPDVLRRAGVHRARAVLVDGRDDNDALAIAVTVGHVVSGAHIVVTLRNMERDALLKYVDESIRCVQWHTPRMITEELTSPGIAEVYAQLMTAGGANTYSTELPESMGAVRVEQCQAALGKNFGATVLAARGAEDLHVNPDWSVELPAGAVLYYVSPRRLTSAEIGQALRG
ncbi:ion channel [Parasphingorhabdus pacifica]